MEFFGAVLYEPNHPLRIESLTLPELRHGQVLVKLAYSGICRSQLMEITGQRGEDGYLPHLLGHEGSGTIKAVGRGVTKVKPGDRVILGWIKATGIDAGGTCYTRGGQSINAGPVTTFSEYAVVSENRCVPLPIGIPLDVAVLFGCALPTGIGMVLNELALKAPDRVAIFGLGGIGMSALLAAAGVGCRQLIAVDISEHKLKLAREFGATHTIDAGRTDPVAYIRELTHREGVDYSIEAAGTVATIEQAFESVRFNGGLCLFASHPGTGEKIKLDPHHLIRGRRIRGTWGGLCDPDRDVPRFAALAVEAGLPLERLIDSRYPLIRINEAMTDLAANRAIRIILEIDATQ